MYRKKQAEELYKYWKQSGLKWDEFINDKFAQVEVGKWVVSDNGEVIYVTKVEDNTFEGYGSHNGKFAQHKWWIISFFKPAPRELVIEKMTKLANSLYKEWDVVKCLSDGCKYTIKSFDPDYYRLINYGELWFTGKGEYVSILVLHKGKLAEKVNTNQQLINQIEQIEQELKVLKSKIK
jgi:hypothetical protein